MIEIVVEQDHSMGRHDAKQAVKKMLAKDDTTSSLEQSWNGFKCELTGDGIEGKIDVGDSRVAIAMKLSILVRATGFTSHDVKTSMETRLANALG